MREGDFLTISQASELLGISRLRVREALYAGVVEGRRGNTGDWMVRWEPADTAYLRDMRDRRPTPGQRIEILFDEVEELERTVEDRDETIARLTKLTSHQNSLLERFSAFAEDRGGSESHAERQINQLSRTLDQALTALERVIDQLETSQQQNDAMAKLVDRSLVAGERFEDVLRGNEELISRQRKQIEHLLGIADESLRRLGEQTNRRRGFFDRVLGR